MTITETQSETMTALAALGFGVTNAYGDGVVRMAKLQDGQKVGVFVRADGSVSEPHTTATQIVSTMLRSEGLR